MHKNRKKMIRFNDILMGRKGKKIIVVKKGICSLENFICQASQNQILIYQLFKDFYTIVSK